MDNEQFDKLMRLFRHTCVLCFNPAATIHEIIPKSYAPKTWDTPENQVALCAECHHHVHTNGAMNFEEELKSARQRALGLLE